MREQAPTFVTKIVTLHNYLETPFTFYWAKVPYTLAPGERMRMEDWKARHAAKHMADAWYNIHKPGLNRHVEDDFIAKMKEAIIDDGKPAAEASPGEISRQQTEMLNEAPLPMTKPVLCDECQATGPRHKKGCSHATPAA
jgi:hypothetical protein